MEAVIVQSLESGPAISSEERVNGADRERTLGLEGSDLE